VKAHIEAMSIAHALFLLPPFHGGGRRKITHKPKIYAFDTGFVTFVRGWDTIREDDRGLLWEHVVLDMLRTVVDNRNLFYWRDKSGREVDFVIRDTRQQADAVQCKINPDSFEPAALFVFRSLYPEGRNYVLSPHVKTAYQRRYGGLRADFIFTQQMFNRTWAKAPGG
jgi:uncharacterized protein